MDAVALLIICVLPLTGVIEMNEALSGVSDPNIVLIAALFVIGEGRWAAENFGNAQVNPADLTWDFGASANNNGLTINVGPALKNPDGSSKVNGIFTAVPYCIDLIEGPYLTTDESRIVAFRPKK